MSGMIRRLRWKIVGISMLFVTLVLAAVFPLLCPRGFVPEGQNAGVSSAFQKNIQLIFLRPELSAGKIRKQAGKPPPVRKGIRVCFINLL